MTTKQSSKAKSTGHTGLPGQDKESPESQETNKSLDAKQKARETIVKNQMDAGKSREEAEAVADELIKKAEQEAEDDQQYQTGEFDHDFLKVYMDDPFLGSISLGVTKVPDNKMPTAYVGMRPNGKSHEVMMGFNPKFFRSLNKKQRQGVIKHEMYHLIFQHIFDRAVGDKEYQMLWNWATDLAINSIIGKDNLPDACLIPGHRPINPSTGKPIEGEYADYIEKAPKLESSDHYFEKLREIEQQSQNDDGQSAIDIAVGQGMDSIDDHDKWGELPPEVQDQIRDKVRDLVEDAVKRAQRTNDWGSVPSEIQEVIKKMLSREIDWKSVLKNFMGRCRTMHRNCTIKKINKKQPYVFPGVKRKYVARFGVFIDQSGSMSDEDIAMLFSELEGFAKEAPLDVYHFDTEVDENSHTKWEAHKPFPEAHRTRCGGTDFQSVADFCNKPENRGRWSGVLLLTDGFAPTMGMINGARVMWVITEHGSMDAVRPGDMAVQMKKDKQFKRY